MKISAEDFRHRLLPILLAQGVGLACGVAGVKLVSQLVAPADYGAYGVFVSLASIGAGVIYAGLVKFVSRHWQTTTDRAGLWHEVLAATRRRTWWLFAAAVAAAVFVAPDSRVLYAVALFASAGLLMRTQLAQSALQAAREHWRDLGVSAGVSLTRSFAPPLLYSVMDLGLGALLFGFALQAMVGAALGAWAIHRWVRDADRPPATPVLTAIYDGPRFVALAIAGWALLGLNRWIVAAFFGAETAGYFTLAANIGTILPSMAGMVMLQYVQPQWFAADALSEPARRQLLRDVDRVALVYTALALALAFALHRAMPLLVGPLVSARYAPAATFVLVAGFSTVSITTGIFYHAMLLAAKREKDCSTADLSGAVCLVAGGLGSAAAGLEWFQRWLLVSPAVPWLVNRTLARRALFKSA